MRAPHRVVLWLLLLAIGGMAAAQEGGAPAQDQAKVALWIFEARVRSFAPGIDAVISLTDEQKQKLGEAYGAVLGTTAVRLANMVLEDSGASLAQRQMAAATVVQAQSDFRARSRGVFTEEQRVLIDKVYAAFNKVYEAAQKALIDEVKAGLAKELDGVLTPQQKQAMEQKRAEIEEAARQAAPGGQTPPAGGN